MLLAFVVGASLRSPADSPRPENPFFHPAGNLEIVWNAPTAALPKNLRVYKIIPQTFSSVVISNAMALASFQMRDLTSPRDYKTVLYFQDSKDESWSRSLTIIPDAGQILYRIRTNSINSDGIPNDEEVARRTWDYLPQFQIDPAQMNKNPGIRRIENCGGNNSTNVCARGIFLTRKVDGIEVRNIGFGMDFSSHAQIKGFYLIWPKLEVSGNFQTATPEQIVAWIKEGKAFPTEDELRDAAKVKNLSNAKKLIITKITPEYGEGKYGEAPTADSENYVSPFGILEGVADLGDINISFRFYCPILSTNIIKL